MRLLFHIWHSIIVLVCSESLYCRTSKHLRIFPLFILAVKFLSSLCNHCRCFFFFFSLDESSSSGVGDSGSVVNSALDFVEEKMFCHHCDGKIINCQSDNLQGDHGGLALTLDSGPLWLLHWPRIECQCQVLSDLQCNMKHNQAWKSPCEG